MNEPKFTPGPWDYYDNGFDGGIVSGYRECGEDCEEYHTFGKRAHYDEWIVGGEPSEGRIYAGDPNRHLIAAAPELYEALEASFRILDGDDIDADFFTWKDRARAALAKARGKT